VSRIVVVALVFATACACAADPLTGYVPASALRLARTQPREIAPAEIFVRFDLRRDAGRWVIERTDEWVMGESAPRTPRP
jgi:hypothetical protein